MRLSDIDLRLLRVFKAVAEAGGFVKAQDVLGINQPAISSHIANLEQRLGVRLCNRGRGGFSLTARGLEVFTETSDLLDYVEEYSKKLNSIGKKAAQLVRIGVIDCLLTDPGNPIPSCIRASKEKYGDMRVRIGVYDYLDCINELHSKRLDVAIVGLVEGEEFPENLEAIEIFEERSGLYCSPTHPCAKLADGPDLLEGLEAARISAHSFVQNPVDVHLDLLLRDENVELEQGNAESTVYLALAGTHVGLIPDHFADIWVRRGQLIQIAPNRIQAVSSFHAVRLKSVQPHAALKYLWRQLGQVT